MDPPLYSVSGGLNHSGHISQGGFVLTMAQFNAWLLFSGQMVQINSPPLLSMGLLTSMESSLPLIYSIENGLFEVTLWASYVR
jgi:hypothetical protein